MYTLLGSQRTFKFIYVLTDDPSFFERYLGKRSDVVYILINKTAIREMRGSIDFVHRMKIASIERVMGADKDSDRFLYIDSDTFILQDLDTVAENISPADSVTHTHEFRFADAIDEPENNQTRQLLLMIRQGIIKFEDRGIAATLDDNFSSWNAGVLGLHRSHIVLLPTVYALTDAIYTKIHHHAAEQFSFSYLLQRNTQVHTCDEQIYHYWPAVQKAIAEELFLSLFNPSFEQLPFALQLSRVTALRDKLPASFATHYLYWKNRAIQSFNRDQLIDGHLLSLRAFIRRPFGDPTFILDILYHTKRILTGKAAKR
jgi:hypothetical protein